MNTKIDLAPQVHAKRLIIEKKAWRKSLNGISKRKQKFETLVYFR